jgi:hypothetical protein
MRPRQAERSHVARIAEKVSVKGEAVMAVLGEDGADPGVDLGAGPGVDLHLRAIRSRRRMEMRGMMRKSSH